MKHTKVAIISILAILLMFSASATFAQTGGSIRLVHAVGGGPNVDITINGQLIAVDVGFGSATAYLPITANSADIVVNVTGQPTTVVRQLVAVSSTPLTIVIAGESPELLIYGDNLDPLENGQARLTAIHAISEGPAVDVVLTDGRPVIAFLEYGVPYGTLDVPASSYQLTAIPSGSTIQRAILPQPLTAPLVAGNSYMLVIYGTVSNPQTLLLSEPVGNARTAPAALAPTLGAPTPQPVLIQPTSAAPVAVATSALPAQPLAPTENPIPRDAVTGRIILNPGANLHLREYAGSDQRSLGLAPSGATLIVVGRIGPPIQLEGAFSDELQEEIDDYVDPASLLEEDADLDSTETWVYVIFRTPDGGSIEAWVLSQFLDIREPNGDRQRLADLPLVARNNFGEAINTDITPPPIPENIVYAEVKGINPGSNLQVRRTPATTGESLALLPLGTVMELVGFEQREDEPATVETAAAAEWIFIRYTPVEGGEITGWVSTTFVDIIFRDAIVELIELDQRGLLAFSESTERGALSRGAAAPPTPTVNPLRDAVAAQVVLNPGANLQFRRTPSVDGESLGLIPSGTQMLVTGRDADGEWVRVEFEGQTGWVSTQFIRLTFNGVNYDINNVVVAE